MDLQSQTQQFGGHNLTIEGQLSDQFAANLLAALNWCKDQPACEDNLGIPRSQMPQLGFGAIPAFVEWLEKKGIRSKARVIEVGKLRATQREINADKVESIARGGEAVGGDPIPVSREGFILDGHHRWAALLSRNPRNRIKTVQIDAPIRPLLKLANKFPGVYQMGFEDQLQPQPRLTLGGFYSYDRRR